MITLALLRAKLFERAVSKVSPENDPIGLSQPQRLSFLLRNIELARNSQLILGEFRSHKELIWGVPDGKLSL